MIIFYTIPNEFDFTYYFLGYHWTGGLKMYERLNIVLK